MTSLQKYIRTYFGLPADELEKVAALFHEQQLSRGDYFLREGQFCTSLSFLHSGFIRVFAHAGEKEVTQWISSPGYFITDLSSFIFGQRARWTIQAISDCTLFTIDAENYKRLNQLIPSWPEIEKRFISGCFVMLENRMFSHLSMSAEERYERLYEQNKELFTQVPQHYLASMLGMTPETFSRIRKKSIS